MIVELASMAVVAYVAYSALGGTMKSSSVTQALNERIDNGYQFRDITYTTDLDLAHPDVKNNNLVHSGLVVSDRGMNGLSRGYTQLYSGVSEVCQLYRTDNLFL